MTCMLPIDRRAPPPRRSPGAEGGRKGLSGESFEVKAIGVVESPLEELDEAPRQGDEGAPDAWLRFAPSVRAGLDGLRPGDVVVLLTWLDRARRDVLRVHPRGDASRAEQGVFTTRSPDRPNPIGLHRVEILAVDGLRVRVSCLEAVDGTPIVDVKPVLHRDVRER
jgi:tRNA-Thr(GGU) m(6)t(6)A37 methyltransferase TsaA